MSVPHPIPYQGSKRRLAPAILACLPADTRCLIEPFAGSAALSLAAAAQGKAQTFRLCDTNAPLVALWQNILDAPEQVAARYAELWHAGQKPAAYTQVRAEFNRTREPALLLYLLARCTKASVRYNSRGEFNQSADRRRQGTRPPRMGAHLLAASKLLNGRTQVCAQDYTLALNDAGPLDVVYLDPPYQGVCQTRDRRYAAGVRADTLVAALARLNEQSISYLLSYDGQTGDKAHGSPLPASLHLTRIALNAGLSSQATLLGRREQTVESLYLSPALTARLSPPLRSPASSSAP